MKTNFRISIPSLLILHFSLLILLSSCGANKAKIKNDLKVYFDSAHVDGCFSMFNNANGEVSVYNLKLDTQRFCPASTFKIVNSLIGVETGRITDENMVIKWNGVPAGNPAWDKDLTMKEAFKVSAVPYFQEVARRIGRDTMKYWVDSLRYGNMNISGPVDSFWLNNTLKISPDEQVGLVKKLYFDKLPFHKTTMETVRNVMLMEDNTLYKLSYKTGRAFDEQNNYIGWVVGWIEENKHVYFFTTFVTTPDHNIDMPTVRMNITKGILGKLGFLKGEK